MADPIAGLCRFGRINTLGVMKGDFGFPPAALGRNEGGGFYIFRRIIRLWATVKPVLNFLKRPDPTSTNITARWKAVFLDSTL
jgi:hypothetical protein